MASLDLKPQWHLPSAVGAGAVLPGGEGLGVHTWLCAGREGGHPSRSSLRPVGSPWAGVESCLPPVSAPWTRVLFQILTTVLTGHVPDCLLGSSLPPFLAGGFPLGWAPFT